MTPRRQNSQKVRRRSASQALVIVLLEYPRVAGQVDARRTDVHPSASESSASENPLSERSSTSGRGFASSPRRLIQLERSPSSRAGRSEERRVGKEWRSRWAADE